ncbi:hypothetical protein F5I97DRAFT_2071222 [Phlebopus sp. FC_14]|nr:hypothetical protein F5I97DRAFT_2071222 [Phlebopus sp. FC_14]
MHRGRVNLSKSRMQRDRPRVHVHRGRVRKRNVTTTTTTNMSILLRRPKKKPKEVVYTVRAPMTAFGYKVIGILFNAAPIRGRGTVVWVVQADKVVALKLSWQDVARKEQRDKVLKILSNNKSHNNVLYPTAYMPLCSGSLLEKGEDSTLRTIRAFTSDEVEGWATQHGVEDRVLEVHVIDLGRPVMFFWSVQDFVMGLCGHQYLVQIGILHHDISENNILLALIPGLIRGYITDFDMAIPYQKTVPQQQPLNLMKFAFRPFKAERTGTTPFMSINVLGSEGHTHYDDIESFLYVLVLFFMTYKHPLSAVDLRDAETQKYTQNVTNARRPYITDWPPLFQLWNTPHARHSKLAFFSVDDHARVFADTIRNHWKDDVVVASIVELLVSCRELFSILSATSLTGSSSLFLTNGLDVIQFLLQATTVARSNHRDFPLRACRELQDSTRVILQTGVMAMPEEADVQSSAFRPLEPATLPRLSFMNVVDDW